jgi:hypothetical protein
MRARISLQLLEAVVSCHLPFSGLHALIEVELNSQPRLAGRNCMNEQKIPMEGLGYLGSIPKNPFGIRL